MTRSLFIRSPKLGVLNLVGEHAEPAVAEDAKAFGGLFGKPVAAAPGSVPQCDVLLFYGEIERSGAVKEFATTLGSIIVASHAKVVVIAWNNPGDAYFAATKAPGFPNCSMVMTVDRRGPRLGSFLRKLFSEMFVGTPIATAWEKHAPAVPDARGGEAPNALFHPGAAGLAFEP